MSYFAFFYGYYNQITFRLQYHHQYVTLPYSTLNFALSLVEKNYMLFFYLYMHIFIEKTQSIFFFTGIIGPIRRIKVNKPQVTPFDGLPYSSTLVEMITSSTLLAIKMELLNISV